MTNRPRAAIVLAAGLATRMRPMTDETAKPLLLLGGRPLLDYALDHLAAEGVETVAVNAFWQAEKVIAYVAARPPRPKVIAVRETELLDTGGSVRYAWRHLGDDPFFVLNGDAFWLDGPTPALNRMTHALTEDVDVVLLVHRTFQIDAATGQGDFAVNQLGIPRRPKEREIVPYLFAGASLMRPALLDGMPDGPFSLNRVWDRSMESGRIRVVVHDGVWFHLSTPADLTEAEQVLEARISGDLWRSWT